MAQNQNQTQSDGRGESIHNSNQRGDNADRLRGQLPKHQEQDPSRRGGEKNNQQDDPRNK